MGRLIDADALKEVIEDHVTSVSCCATVEQARGKTAFKHECLEDIDNAPTVDAVPVVHGKKLYQSPVDPKSMICFKRCVYKCSWCGEFIAADWTYCPYCGAKMDGGEYDE